MVRREAIPADFVDFMDYAVEMLDSPEEDDRSLVDLDDGLQWENGYGGRAEGRFTFVFFPEGRDERWTIVLDEDSVRGIAAGTVVDFEVDAEPFVAQRTSRTAQLAAALAPPPAPAVAILRALVDRALVALAPRARLETVADKLERPLFDLLDHPSLDDETRAAAIVELLVDLPGVDDVFGEDAEILAETRKHARD